MRFTKTLTLATALLFAGAAAGAAPSSILDVNPNVATVAPVMTIAAVQQAQPPQTEIKVDLDDDDTVWYMDPVWLAIGAIALLIVIVLAVMAARGGGGRDSTTVVR